MTHPVSHMTNDPRPSDHGHRIQTTSDLNVVTSTPVVMPKRVRDLPAVPPAPPAPPAGDWGFGSEPDEEGWYPLTGALAGASVRTEYLSASKMVRDPIRRIRERRVQELVRKFDRGELGTILVSRRSNGDDVVVEGNHRHETISRLGLLPVLTLRCEVYKGLTLEQEAVVWRSCEDRLRPTPLDKFHGRLQEREPKARAIQASLDEHGVVFYEPGLARWPMLQAGKQVERIFDLVGGYYLAEALGHAKRSWPYQKAAFTGEILTALAFVRHRSKDAINVAWLDAKLKATTAQDLVAAGEQLQRLVRGRYPDAKAQAIASVIVGLYNKRRSSNALPEWEWRR